MRSVPERLPERSGGGGLGGGGVVALTKELQPPPPTKNSETETPAQKIDRLVDSWASDKLARGEQIYDVEKWRAQARARIVRNVEHWPSYIEETLRAMDNPPDADTTRLTRPSAAEAHRRLYDAKLADLQRYRMPAPERVQIAMDYACSEMHRFYEPGTMPPRGVVQLEDDLYRVLGVDRLTGLRYPPQAPAS